MKTTPIVVTYERNSYYFKVDEEGNQLPYIDRIRSELVTDVEIGTMKVLGGEVDYMREDAGISNLPLYKEHEEESDYRTVLLKTPGAKVNMRLNLTYEDLCGARL